MAVVGDIHTRLQAALGPDVPVLLPEQQREPLEGRRPGQPGGLTGYLAQHPQGYVQIEEPLPISSDGLTGVFWVAVASICPTASAAAALAQQVRRALSGTPFTPGPHQEVTPAQPQQLSPGAWMVRPTFDALTIDGEHIARE